MSVHRPTFSESWYRVADLRPQLRAGVRVHRQHFRGEAWHVLEDPVGDQYHRLNDAAYRFVGLLDGSRTVQQAWSMVAQRYGDDAPTQNEALRLLQQLYGSNLLHADLPADAESLFKKNRKRAHREWRGKLTNFLFIKLPLVDPDHFLSKWLTIGKLPFTLVGFAVWCVLVVLGLAAIVSRWEDFAASSADVLAPSNLFLLYVAFVFTKLIHELGHAFAAKYFGKREGAGGEVHQMGVMIAALIPAPYVDASSAWALRSKWRRMVVGAAGMYVELAIAAVAAMVWARAGEGTTIAALAHNVVFVAGVTTIVFNANPLLRYDGYYILSDLLETPNLQQRSNEHIYYLVKNYVWGVKRAFSPARTESEKWLLTSYGIFSAIYRVTVLATIVWYISGRWFIVGVAVAVVSGTMMLLMPIGKLVKYLATNQEIARVRARAMWSTIGVTTAALILIGLVPVPDRVRIEGVVEPRIVAEVFMAADGFVRDIKPDGTVVTGGQDAIVRAENESLVAAEKGIQAELDEAAARQRLARSTDPVSAKIENDRVAALEARLNGARDRLESLTIHAPIDGVWVSFDAKEREGAFVRRGTRLGAVVSAQNMVVRAVARQDVAALIVGEARPTVDVRVRQRPDTESSGTFEQPKAAATRDLPSEALGFASGGSIATSANGRDQPTRAAETFFEVRVTPNAPEEFRAGQRVVVRFALPDKPLLQQAFRALGQALQRRARMVS